MKTKNRVPWSEQEDDVLRYDYARDNDAFPTYQQFADILNLELP